MYAAHLYILRAINPVPSHRLERSESRSKVAEKGRLFEETVAPHRRSTFLHIKDRLNHIIHMALGIHPTGYGEAHQFHRCG
jgi:hypothetical protein